jgi:hypothetical protein
MDWIENERFAHVFAKTIIFMPKTGSINSGNGVLSSDADYFTERIIQPVFSSLTTFPNDVQQTVGRLAVKE